MGSISLTGDIDSRCGLNLWIRKLVVDGEEMEQTM
jgi:hypothetical protein